MADDYTIVRQAAFDTGKYRYEWWTSGDGMVSQFRKVEISGDQEVIVVQQTWRGETSHHRAEREFTEAVLFFNAHERDPWSTSRAPEVVFDG